MTHDIDHLNYVPSVKKSASERVKYEISSKIMNEPYGDNIQDIIDIENQKGIKSTFFMLSNYPEDKRFQEIIQIIKSNGMEIGLHGSEVSFNDANQMKKEKEKLEKVSGSLIGVRQHL